jgi:hypothetical protein
MYLQTDPEIARSWSSYGYAEDDPVTKVDPDGRRRIDIPHQEFEITAGIGLGWCAGEPFCGGPVGGGISWGSGSGGFQHPGPPSPLDPNKDALDRCTSGLPLAGDCCVSGFDQPTCFRIMDRRYYTADLIAECAIGKHPIDCFNCFKQRGALGVCGSCMQDHAVSSGGDPGSETKCADRIADFYCALADFAYDFNESFCRKFPDSCNPLDCETCGP